MGVYKDEGYDLVLKSAITGSLLVLAALLFVDDTDLFDVAEPNQSEDEFLDHIQGALLLWGMLALATGGYLKQSKCQVALALFRLIE